ncbi:MAG: hypothetical protein H7843_00635 [Nitrospirota bacterium]
MKLIDERRIPSPDAVGVWLSRMGEEDGVTRGITASHNKAVKALINSIEEAMWNEPERGCGYELAETVHCMNKIGKSFRMVLKRELRNQANLFEEGKYFHHVIATNWLEEEKTGNEVIKWHYLSYSPGRSFIQPVRLSVVQHILTASSIRGLYGNLTIHKIHMTTLLLCRSLVLWIIFILTNKI